MENIDFSNRPHVNHLIKGSCLGVCWYIFCKLRMYFICHVTPQNHSVEMLCIFMGESTLQHVTTLKSLVTIGILIVSGRMLHQKRGSYKYVLPLKNWVDWTNTKREKIVNLKNVHLTKTRGKNVETNEDCILRKMSWENLASNFLCKIAFLIKQKQVNEELILWIELPR